MQVASGKDAAFIRWNGTGPVQPGSPGNRSDLNGNATDDRVSDRLPD